MGEVNDRPVAPNGAEQLFLQFSFGESASDSFQNGRAFQTEDAFKLLLGFPLRSRDFVRVGSGESGEPVRYV